MDESEEASMAEEQGRRITIEGADDGEPGELPPPKDPTKVKSFQEAMQEMRATPAEEAILNAGGTFDDLPERRQAQTLDEAAARDPNSIPEWVKIPPKMKIPDGKEVAFMLFRAKWTDKPHLGDRQVVLWSLTDADEKLAMKRTRGEHLRSLSESAKQCIRAIDGVSADWSGNFTLGNVNTFWNEIGPKCRQLIANYYAKTHTLEVAEQLDFFANCVVVRRATAVASPAGGTATTGTTSTPT